MKILLKILLVLPLVLWLVWSAVAQGVPLFLQDMAYLHASIMTGREVSSSRPEIDWRQRRLQWPDWKIAAAQPAGPALVTIANIEIQMPIDFQPIFERAAMLPSPLHLDLIAVDGVVLDYDVDSDAASLRSLRLQLSTAASNGLRDRLNAGSRGAELLQLLIVNRLQVRNIKVQARSAGEPLWSKTFAVGNLSFDRIGASEGGVTVAEIGDRVCRIMMDEVQRQAILQGVADNGEGDSRKKLRGARDGGAGSDLQDDVDRDENGRVKKAAQAVGQGFKDLGRGFKQGWKKITD